MYKISESDVAILRKMAQRERSSTPRTSPHVHKIPRNLGGGGTDIKFGKAAVDIEPDTETGSVKIWDTSVTPPVESSPLEQIDDVIFDWLSDQKISAGKEVAIAKVAGLNRWRILWAECEDPQVSLYDDGGTPPATITPGNTAVLPLSLSSVGSNPHFTIVGGNSLQAIESVTLRLEMGVQTEYIAGANNQEIACNVQVVGTAGTPTNLIVPLRDSFQSSRAGTFLKNHTMPTGAMKFFTGDTIQFVAENEASSNMDLDVTGYIISWS